MHQAVLDGDVQKLGVGDRARVDLVAEALVVVADFFERRPVFGAIGRERSSHGIDAEGEEAVELRME